MIKKLTRLWNKYVVYKGIKLTPKGECFKNYCQQIVDEILNTNIESYEEFIYYIQTLLEHDHNIVLGRKETAEFILEAYKEIL